MNTKTALVLMYMDVKIKKIFPLRITTIDVTRHCVNFLYVNASETSHYVLLKDLSRLISRQIVITMTKDISDNIVYVTKPAKRD